MENDAIIIDHYYEYNFRRYSAPWVAKVGKDGNPDFTTRVGEFTGDRYVGSEGDLVIYHPEEGAIYMYGQRDYRGNNTEKNYAKYNEGVLVPMTRQEVKKECLGLK